MAMKTKNPIPNFTMPATYSRSWMKQTTAAGHIISRKRRRHAGPAPWPPGSNLTLGYEPPAAGNRRWHTWCYQQWTQLLAPSDRAAWEAAAVTMSIVNFKGKTITPNGFQLFIWWQSYQAFGCWVPLSPFTPGNYSIDNTPTDPTWAKLTPTAVSITDTTPPTFTIAFTATAIDGTFAVFVDATPSVETGCKNPTSHWHRVPPTLPNVYTPNMFSANVTTGHPVPPWTATPTYSAPDWLGNGVYLVGAALGGLDTIRAGISSTTYNLSTSFSIAGLVANTATTIAWGIQSTGARYALLLTTINPSTGLPYPNGHPHFFIASFTSWTSAPTYLGTGLDALSTWTGMHPYSMTRDGTNDSVSTPAGNLFNAVASPPSTDVGLSADLGTSQAYGPFTVAGPINYWSAQFNYQNIFENPAISGPRAAKLILGAVPGNNLRHSDPAPFTLSL